VKHLTLDQRISPGTASGAPPPLSCRRASTLTAAAPAPPLEAGRATDHRSLEERVLARRASDHGAVGADGLAALVSNHAPESLIPSQVRRASKKKSSELYNRRRTVGDAAHHQQASCRAHCSCTSSASTHLGTHMHTSTLHLRRPHAPHLHRICGRPSQAHVAAAFRAAREAGWTLKAHLENLDRRFSDSIAKPQSETTVEAALPAMIKATPAEEFAAAVPPTAPPAPPPAAPLTALSYILAQPPEEPPQERPSPPRSRQPTKESIDSANTREAQVQRRRVSQLICGPVVSQLILQGAVI